MKTRSFLTWAAAFVCGVVLADNKKPAPVVQVDVDGAQKLIETGQVIVLDIRTPEEFAEGHIAGAKNLDFIDSGFEQKVGGLDRGKSYLVHCASGGRSTRALEYFEKLGFRSVYHLGSGFSAWEAAGKPLAK